MALPVGWPLVAIGGEAYKALAYLYPNRNGDRGAPSDNVKNQVRDVLEKPAGELVWLEG